MKIEKCQKCVCILYDNEKHFVQTKILKQTLNHELAMKKVRWIREFHQKGMNTKLKTEGKSDSEKNFFKLKNHSVVGKTMDNTRKHRDLRFVTAGKRRRYLESEPNHHITKWFSENLLAIEMKKTKVKMNKPLCLGLSRLSISKTIIYEFWYDSTTLKC